MQVAVQCLDRGRLMWQVWMSLVASAVLLHQATLASQEDARCSKATRTEIEQKLAEERKDYEGHRRAIDQASVHDQGEHACSGCNAQHEASSFKALCAPQVNSRLALQLHTRVMELEKFKELHEDMIRNSEARRQELELLQTEVQQLRKHSAVQTLGTARLEQEAEASRLAESQAKRDLGIVESRSGKCACFMDCAALTVLIPTLCRGPRRWCFRSVRKSFYFSVLLCFNLSSL